MQTKDGVIDILMNVYIVDGKVPFIFGINTMDKLGVNLDLEKNLNIRVNNKEEIVSTVKAGSHQIKIMLKILKEKSDILSVVWESMKLLRTRWAVNTWVGAVLTNVSATHQCLAARLYGSEATQTEDFIDVTPAKEGKNESEVHRAIPNS